MSWEWAVSNLLFLVLLPRYATSPQKSLQHSDGCRGLRYQLRGHTSEVCLGMRLTNRRTAWDGEDSNSNASSWLCLR